MTTGLSAKFAVFKTSFHFLDLARRKLDTMCFTERIVDHCPSQTNNLELNVLVNFQRLLSDETVQLVITFEGTINQHHPQDEQKESKLGGGGNRSAFRAPLA